MASTEAADPFLDEDEMDRFKQREWTKEEWRLYNRAFKQSEGFDVPVLPPNGYCGMLGRIPDCYLPSIENLPELAGIGIQHYNSNNGTHFELVEVEKACMRVAAGAIYYLTLKVRPTGMPAHCPTTCLQAEVWQRVRRIEPILSRIKLDYSPSSPRAKLQFQWSKLRCQPTKLRFSRLSSTNKLRFKKKRSTIKP